MNKLDTTKVLNFIEDHIVLHGIDEVVIKEDDDTIFLEISNSNKETAKYTISTYDMNEIIPVGDEVVFDSSVQHLRNIDSLAFNKFKETLNMVINSYAGWRITVFPNEVILLLAGERFYCNTAYNNYWSCGSASSDNLTRLILEFTQNKSMASSQAIQYFFYMANKGLSLDSMSIRRSDKKAKCTVTTLKKEKKEIVWYTDSGVVVDNNGNEVNTKDRIYRVLGLDYDSSSLYERIPSNVMREFFKAFDELDEDYILFSTPIGVSMMDSDGDLQLFNAITGHWKHAEL